MGVAAGGFPFFCGFSGGSAVGGGALRTGGSIVGAGAGGGGNGAWRSASSSAAAAALSRNADVAANVANALAALNCWTCSGVFAVVGISHSGELGPSSANVHLLFVLVPGVLCRLQALVVEAGPPDAAAV